MPERKSILHRTFLQLLDIVALELLVLCLIEASVILLYHNNSRNSLIILGKRVAVIYALIRSVVALIRLVFFVLSFFISSDLTKAFIVILCGTAYAFWKQAYSDWIYATISSNLGSFYAVVGRRAYLYTWNRIVKALHLCSYLIIVYLMWLPFSYLLRFLGKMIKEELAVHKYDKKQEDQRPKDKSLIP
ncbi:hypothetical protein WA588_003667 [Blastocystis sp. NMH]